MGIHYRQAVEAMVPIIKGLGQSKAGIFLHLIIQPLLNIIKNTTEMQLLIWLLQVRKLRGKKIF